MTESTKELLAGEAAEAEARAEAEEAGQVAVSRGQRGQRGRRRAEDPSQVYAVRIPVSRLTQLRELADRLDVPPTVLIRQWVIERLDTDRGGEVSPLTRPPMAVRRAPSA